MRVRDQAHIQQRLLLRPGVPHAATAAETAWRQRPGGLTAANRRIENGPTNFCGLRLSTNAKRKASITCDTADVRSHSTTAVRVLPCAGGTPSIGFPCAPVRQFPACRSAPIEGEQTSSSQAGRKHEGERIRRGANQACAGGCDASRDAKLTDWVELDGVLVGLWSSG